MTNHTSLLGNGTAASDDEVELYMRIFAEYSWAPPLIGSIAATGFILNVFLLILICRTPALRNNNTAMMLVAGALHALCRGDPQYNQRCRRRHPPSPLVTTHPTTYELSPPSFSFLICT